MWHHYAFVSADFALLAFTLIYPNPLVPTDLPPQFGLRFGNFIYFFVLLSSLAYVYRPRLVLWGGLSAAVAWLLGIVWLFSLPGTVWREPQDRDVEVFLQVFASPTFIDFGVRVQEVAVLLICAGLLALAVKRARAVALRQTSLARERTNLARYFPHRTAEMLAGKAAGLSQPREHNAAVLFADLVAFTHWAETRKPAETKDSIHDHSAIGKASDLIAATSYSHTRHITGKHTVEHCLGIWPADLGSQFAGMRKTDLSPQSPVKVFRAYVAVFERPKPPIVDAEMRVMREFLAHQRVGYHRLPKLARATAGEYWLDHELRIALRGCHFVSWCWRLERRIIPITRINCA